MLRGIAMVLLALPVSVAFAEGHALGLKVGALGLGAEYSYEITERVVVRGALYGSKIGADLDEAGISYEADLVWDSLAVGVDFHPLKTALRLSGGLLKNDNRVELVSRPTTNQTIGGTVYTPAEIGTLSGGIEVDDTSTFLGVGWDWSRDKRVFGMSLDLGVVFQDDPNAVLRGSGTLLGDPAFEQDIAAEVAELDVEIDYGAVPFLSLGFMFRF